MTTRAEEKEIHIKQIVEGNYLGSYVVSQYTIELLAEIIKDQQKEIISLKDLIGEPLE